MSAITQPIEVENNQAASPEQDAPQANGTPRQIGKPNDDVETAGYPVDSVPKAGSLSALVDKYATPENLPKAKWLTQLQLVNPRRDVRCLSGWTRFSKRVLDILGATILLTLLSPLMLLTAIAVMVTSSGPILFRQIRVGLNLRQKKQPDRRQNNSNPPDGQERRSGRDRRQDANFGKPFQLFKFRTMRTDAEKNGAQFAQEKDPRVTSIGRFLRKTRLDELPQLWNVLKGEMSLVGPRPERPEFIKDLSAEIPNYLERLGLKPGLTGLAQVLNG